ncbi:MAG: hypothetical protein NVSMB46_02380 [Candidatus Saccharimonadales bacterium]
METFLDPTIGNIADIYRPVEEKSNLLIMQDCLTSIYINYNKPNSLIDPNVHLLTKNEISRSKLPPQHDLAHLKESILDDLQSTFPRDVSIAVKGLKVVSRHRSVLVMELEKNPILESERSAIIKTINWQLGSSIEASDFNYEIKLGRIYTDINFRKVSRILEPHIPSTVVLSEGSLDTKG